MTRRAVLPIAAAVAALALAAPSLAAGPSAWAKSADSICKKYEKKIGEISEPKSLKEAIADNEKFLGFRTAQTKEIAKLSRPAADKADIAKLLGYYDQEIDVVKRLIAALKTNDERKNEKKMSSIIVEGASIANKRKSIAKQLGAVGCTTTNSE